MLDEGQLVLLELAPKDPRSLMQGDYMILRYKTVREVDRDSIPSRGYCVIQTDEFGVGTFVRAQKKAEPLQAGEIPIRYFYNEHMLSIGAESYFFEEGTAEKFDQAKYGGLRIASDGKSILTGLYDKNRVLIQP